MANELTDKCLIKFEDGTTMKQRGLIARMIRLLSEHSQVVTASDRGSVTINYAGGSIKMQASPVFT